LGTPKSRRNVPLGKSGKREENKREVTFAEKHYSRSESVKKKKKNSAFPVF